MVKAYLRYEEAASFGVVASSGVPSIPFSRADGHPCVAAAGVDSVLIWSVRKGEIIARYSNAQLRKAAAVTSLAVHVNGDVVAAGYSDGSVRTWSVEPNDSAQVLPEVEPISTFNGHRAQVMAVAFQECATEHRKKGNPPSRIVTGSADGDIILWDLVTDAGLFRLPAHNGPVTAVILMSRADRDLIISSSKDGLVRVYDVETQHCLQTLVGHRAEVWAMALDPTRGLLLTGSIDAEVRLFRLTHGDSSGDSQKQERAQQNNHDSVANATDGNEVFEPLGSVLRQSAATRVGALHCAMSHGEMFAIVSGVDKSAELFRLRSEENALGHKQRRKKRFLAKREKQNKEQAEEENGAGQNSLTENDAIAEFQDVLEAKDFMVSVRTFRTGSKIRGVRLLPDTFQLSGKSRSSRSLDVQFLVHCLDNAVEFHKLTVSSHSKRKKRKRSGTQPVTEDVDGEQEVSAEVGSMEKVCALDRSGHRGDVRSISLSPDDRLLLSGSKKSLKLWNVATGNCLRSMSSSGYGVSTAFLGADGAYAAVGTKEGGLEFFELGSGSCVAAVADAHGNAIWSMTLDNHIYDADHLITGGADKKVRMWSIGQALDGCAESDKKLLPLRTIGMPDEVLCVCVAINRDRPLLLTSLMDSTVRAVFLDTHEPAMNFYGHRLPVMAMDVSSDGQILATGSADKTVKLWGIDFGDCRRSIRAHSDSVLSIKFQPNTHYFFSGSRDGTLKYWDADKFELITNLEEQRGEVWSMAISGDGEVIASTSHDRLMRIWRRTDEPLFLQEEQDRRMDEMFESTLVEEDVKEAQKARTTPIEFLDDSSAGEALRAGKMSLDTVKGGEKLLEALQLCAEEKERVDGGSEDAPNPLLLGLSPDIYLLRTLERIRTADLDEVVHVLPLKDAMALLRYVCELLDEENVKNRLSVEALIRTGVQLVKLHQSQIVAGACDRATIELLLRRMRSQVGELRERVGFNMAGLGFWQAHLAAHNNAAFRDASARVFNMQAKRKRKLAVQ